MSQQLTDRRCPYCFAALPAKHELVACPVKSKGDGSECALATPQSIAGEKGICEEHGVALVPHCWYESCRQALPPGWHEVTTTCLAMAGTRNSGKTVYVWMVANLLLTWGRLNGLTVSHYSTESRISFEQRFTRLDPSASLYGSTAPESPGGFRRQVQQEPIMLRIQEAGRSRDHVLVLRDVAGENVQDAAMDREHFRFLVQADGLILLVDPGDARAVRNALDGHVDLHSAGFNPAAVWGNVESLAGSVLGNGARRPPMAVTISKFDLVLAASQVAETPLSEALAGHGLRIHHDPSLDHRAYDLGDADLLDCELRTLCARYLDQPQLVERAEAFGEGRARFFAISSLGTPPVAQRVARHGTPSYRCLDPIKWFLMLAGLVPAA